MKDVRYFDALTAMRGIAALWVMAFHIDVSLFYRDMGALVPRDATGLLSKGYLWVDFFFLLSGFILAHVYGESLSGPRRWTAMIDYLWARFARIYPLHMLTFGLVVIIALTYPLFLPQVKDGSWETFMAWRAIPSNLLLTHAMNQHTYLSWNIVSWSIGAEWWTCVFTVGLLILLHRGPARFAAAMIVVAFALLAGLVYALPDHVLDITYNWGFFRCLFEFVIGLALYRLWREGWFDWAGRGGWSVAALAAVAAVFHFRPPDLIVIPLFAVLITGLATGRSLLDTVLRSAPLQHLGQISYSLYLMHGVAFSAFWFAMPWAKAHFGVPSEEGRLAYAAAFVVIVVAASHLTYYGVERPARLWLMRLRHRSPHTSI